MNKSEGLQYLHRLLSEGAYTQSAIGHALGIDPSQVSRIASGDFKRMDGHALTVCKFARNTLEKEEAERVRPELVKELNELIVQLVAERPETADALSKLIRAVAISSPVELSIPPIEKTEH